MVDILIARGCVDAWMRGCVDACMYINVFSLINFNHMNPRLIRILFLPVGRLLRRPAFLVC